MAPLILTDKTTPAWAGYDGVGAFSVASGKKLTIETSPSGEEILSVTVPDGKTWQVTVSISIIEEG